MHGFSNGIFQVAMDAQQPTINWDSSSLAEELIQFEQYAQPRFFEPLSGKTEKSMCAYLFIWTGGKGRKNFNTFGFEDD